jgi:arginase
MNRNAVVEVARDASRRVGESLRLGELAIVIGGDCTIGIGSVAGCISEFERTALIYFDLHPDLNVPGTVGAGALDWMGTAHMLGVEGADEVLTTLGPRNPLLKPEDVLYFAYGPGNRTKFEAGVFEQLGLHGVSVDDVKTDPSSAASNALEMLDGRYEALVLHLDVDVIDFLDAPLSENTGHNEGLAFDIAMTAFEGLTRTLASRRSLSLK